MVQCIAPKIDCKQTAGKKCTDMSAFPIFHSVNSFDFLPGNLNNINVF